MDSRMISLDYTTVIRALFEGALFNHLGHLEKRLNFAELGRANSLGALFTCARLGKLCYGGFILIFQIFLLVFLFFKLVIMFNSNR